MNVTIDDERDEPGQTPHIAEVAELAELAELVLRQQGLPASTEAAIVLVDAVDMAERNESSLGKRGPTDVLAFPLEDLVPGRAVEWRDDLPPLAIGDVFICPEVVAANATAAGVPFEDELSLMVVHGLLHLLGYDHVDDADAELMESRERELLSLVGRTRP